MKCKIFYSWQSDDRPTRKFVSSCMKKLGKELVDIVEPDVSRDTVGMSGSPDIVDTIFDKIAHTDVFIADVTIVASENSKDYPNSNVLLELGYAVHVLGWERIVLLCNTDKGRIEKLPFDIRQKRMTAFSLVNEKEKESEQRVVGNIKATIKLLKGQNKLHGGEPDLLQIRHEMAKTVLDAIKKIHEVYVQSERDADLDSDLNMDLKEKDYKDDLIVISKKIFEDAGKIKPCIGDENYYELMRLLRYLQKTVEIDDNEDNTEWDYLKKIMTRYFNEIYLEYLEEMPFLPTENIINKQLITLLNTIEGREILKYQIQRFYKGKLVFSDDGTSKEAYGQDGILLCRGTGSLTNFCGWRKTEYYIGEFKNGERDGWGEETSSSFITIFENSVSRSGRWEKGKFVEGAVYNIILEKKDDKLFLVTDSDTEEPYICGIDSGNTIIEAILGNTMDHPNYYFGDGKLKDGKYDIDDSTVKHIEEATIYPDD